MYREPLEMPGLSGRSLLGAFAAGGEHLLGEGESSSQQLPKYLLKGSGCGQICVP